MLDARGGLESQSGEWGSRFKYPVVWLSGLRHLLALLIRLTIRLADCSRVLDGWL